MRCLKGVEEVIGRMRMVGDGDQVDVLGRGWRKGVL